MEYMPLALKQLAEKEGIFVQPEPLPEPVLMDNNTARTEEELYELEIKTMRTIVEAALKRGFEQLDVHEIQPDFVKIHNEVMADHNRLGLPWSKCLYVKHERKHELFEWRAGIAEYTISRARQLRPAFSGSTELKDLEQRKQWLLEQVQLEKAKYEEWRRQMMTNDNN